MCSNKHCLWLRRGQSPEYYIERLGLLTIDCGDVGGLAGVLGVPQLVGAYCSSRPVPALAPSNQPQPAGRLVIKLPGLGRGVLEFVRRALQDCGASLEGQALAVGGPLTRKCRASLNTLLTVLNGAPSLVLDGHVVTIGRGRACVDGDCAVAVDCTYELYRWLRRRGLGLPSAALACGLLILINQATAGGQYARKKGPGQ